MSMREWLLNRSQYAGMYVPCKYDVILSTRDALNLSHSDLANYIYEHPSLKFNLKGIWIADPSLTWGLVQQEIPALRFAQVCMPSIIARAP